MTHSQNILAQLREAERDENLSPELRQDIRDRIDNIEEGEADGD